MADTFTNPVIRGFYPDPSICRKGDDYYLITTTQEFFPVLPVFHSRNLADWEQIGHVISDPVKLNLVKLLQDNKLNLVLLLSLMMSLKITGQALLSIN